MHLRTLHGEDDAVSPVIGVVLMVAVTVVLAASVATFVFGFSDQINATAPQAGFSTKYTSSPEGTADSWGHSYGDFDGDGDAESGSLEVTFTTGEGIDASALSVRYPGGSDEFAGSGSQPYNESDNLGAGDGITLAVAPGDTVRVIWSSPNGGRTTTLTSEEVPG